MKRTAWLLMGRAAFWLAWPALWLYLKFGARTRLLLIHQDSILVVRGWMSDGTWQLPGGGLHTGESKAKGLLREVREETGLQLEHKDVKLLATERYSSKGLGFLCHYYVAHIDRPLHPQTKGYEIAEATWLQRSDITARTCGADVLRAITLMDASR